MKFMNKIIKSYKAFDENMRCRGFQYEVGKEYENGDIKCCKPGFHACESPLEVLDYYDMLTSRFAEVEQSGKIRLEANTTKICSSHIKIKAELKLADIINIGVEWLEDLASRHRSNAEDAVLNDNGNRDTKIGSSGDFAQISSSGKNAKIGSSGFNAKIDSTGEDSVIMCAGPRSVVKAKIGSWITLAEWKQEYGKGRLVPVCVKTERVDGIKIKPDTWYKLQDGEFVEVTE